MSHLLFLVKDERLARKTKERIHNPEVWGYGYLHICYFQPAEYVIVSWI